MVVVTPRCFAVLALIGMALDSLYAQTPPNTVNPKPKNTTVPEYISLYRDISVREMERSGVPASIKLAQGIHESGAGNSTLAREANNHFGVKCGSGWTGKTYYRWDDEAQESCFRVYESAEESYIAHTDFLSKRKHYAFLFAYDRTDYKSWAQGLRKAGYATDPQYPDKLIATIEKYNLQDFDLERSVVLTPNKDTTTTTVTPSTITVIDNKRPLRTKPRSFLFPEHRKGLFLQNGSTYAIARKSESALELAARFGIPYQKFLKFNDLLDGDLLIEYQYAYIQPKKNSYKGEEMFHRVRQDETMYEISQRYGIRLEDLLAMNLLKEGQEPANGEVILLKDKAAFIPNLRPAGHIDALPAPPLDSTALFTPLAPQPDVPRPQSEPLEINQPTYDTLVYRPDTALHTSVTPVVTPEIHPQDDPTWMEKIPDELPPAPAPQPETPLDYGTPTPNIPVSVTEFPAFPAPLVPAPTPVPPAPETWITHKVKSGDTLSRLARQYQVSTKDIQQWNNLSTEAIYLDQKLKIKTNPPR